MNRAIHETLHLYGELFGEIIILCYRSKIAVLRNYCETVLWKIELRKNIRLNFRIK
jgi:hypothetical protein